MATTPYTVAYGTLTCLPSDPCGELLVYAYHDSQRPGYTYPPYIPYTPGTGTQQFHIRSGDTRLCPYYVPSTATGLLIGIKAKAKIYNTYAKNLERSMQVSVIPGDQTVFTAASCYAFSTRPSSYNFGENSSESIGYNTVPVSFASSGTYAGTVYTELTFEAVEWNSTGTLITPSVYVFDLEVALYLVEFYS